MLRTATLLHPASTPASRPTPGASLPGTLVSPRTGLAPAGHRELVARLCHDCSFALTAPELLDARTLHDHNHEPFDLGYYRPHRPACVPAHPNPTNLLAHHEPLMTGFMNPLSRCFVHPQIHQGSDLVFCPAAKIS